MLINNETEEIFEEFEEIFWAVSDLHNPYYEIEYEIDTLSANIKKLEELLNHTGGKIYEDKLNNKQIELENYQSNLEYCIDQINELYKPIEEAFNIQIHCSCFYESIDYFLKNERIIERIKTNDIFIDSHIEAELLEMYPTEFL